MNSNTPVLIIIDVQKGFKDPKWGKRNNLDAEDKIKELLDFWRKKDWPVIHIQHASTSVTSPLHPDQPGFEIMDAVKPQGNEPVIQKEVNSAFIGTNLETMLKEKESVMLVITGLTTNHCVSTTTRMAGNLGFKTYLIGDATAAFDQTDHNGRHYAADEVHNISLANLHGEFATVLSGEEIIKLVSDS